MSSPCGKAQSHWTFSPVAAGAVFHWACPSLLAVISHPAANLNWTFPQPSSVILNLRISNSTFLPFPSSGKLIHLAYFSVTACQCDCFCPRPVLPLSSDCSILPKSSLNFPYITLIAPLSPFASPPACKIDNITAAVLWLILLSPPFSFQNLVFFFFPCLLSLSTSQDLFKISLCPRHQNDTSTSCWNRWTYSQWSRAT